MTLQKCFHCGLAFMIALLLATADIKADTPAKDGYGKNVSYGHTEQELVFVAALNEYRAARGLHSVELNSELSSACRIWSTRMRQSGRLAHDHMGGTEIIAQISSESGINALQAWQRSSAHNAILLSSRIDTIGIGSDGIWWTMRGIQKNAERTVFRTTDSIAEVVYDTVGRVPMSVSRNSVQIATGDVQKGVNTITPSGTTGAGTEVMDDIIGRVPMGVSDYSVQREVNINPPFRYRFR